MSVNGKNSLHLEERLLLQDLIICFTSLPSAYSSGAVDTTYTTLQFFFLAMWLYPDVQHKAQRELDTVVGPHRLPIHADRAALPYVSAIVKEALRWQNAIPNGVPHHTSEDLEYRGFFIQQGTALIPLTCYLPALSLSSIDIYHPPSSLTSVAHPESFYLVSVWSESISAAAQESILPLSAIEGR
ncbi:cytochrome P450 [Daedaleopsis nitida]|nr:cytochrome P450 [Daedaleopsis nitida]